MNACKGCGKPIVWGTTSAGTAVPLDPRAPVFHIVNHSTENGKIVRAEVEQLKFADGNPKAMVSHFATCSNANDFSRSKKAGPPR